MAETKNELLPCPLACGVEGGRIIHETDEYGWKHIECTGCGARSGGYLTAAEAAKMWNKEGQRRHTPPAAICTEKIPCGRSGTHQCMNPLPCADHPPAAIPSYREFTAEKIRRQAASGIADGITEERLKQYPCCLQDSHVSGEEGYSEIRCKRHLNRNGRPESRVTYGPR